MPSTLFTDAQVAILTKPVNVYTRQGPGGIKYPYLKGEDVVSRLNAAFYFEWSSKVSVEAVTEAFVVVKVSLEYKGIIKEAYGGAQIMMKKDTKEPVDLGNAYKSASTNGLKKAAEQFGIGLDMGSSVPVSSSPRHSPTTNSTSNTGRAHGASTTAAASTTVKVAPKKSVEEALAEMAATPATTPAASPTVAPENPTPAAPEAGKLAAAMAALGKLKSGGAPEEAPATVAAQEPPDNPFLSGGKSGPSDIQINTIKKMCEGKDKAEEDIIAECVQLGKIEPTTAKTAADLTRKDAAVIIRHLTVME